MNNKKKSVLFVISFPPPYHGANINNKKLWESRVQEEFDCHLVDISDHRDLNNLGQFDFGNVYLAAKHMINLFVALVRHKPDLVYMLIAQNKWAVLRDGTVIIMAKWFSRARVVCHLRGAFFRHFYDNTSPFMKKFTDYVMNRTNAFILLGETLKFNFTKWSQNLYVIPNGTNLFLEYSAEEKERSRKDNEIVVTYISNFFKSKGIVDVVKSVKSVVQRFPDKKIKYKLAGAWGLDPKLLISAEEIRKEVEEVIEKDSISNNVEFLGVVQGEEKEALFKEADIFLLPTTFYEGHPLSIVEAMAAGCVVISCATAAIPETVIDGETGYIIEPHKPEILADKTAYVIAHEETRKKMSHAARARYESHYTQDKVIDRFVNVFNDTMDKN